MFNGKDGGSIAYYNWFAYEFWRFQFVQQEVGKLAMTAIEYPPMQKGASFNLEAVKAKIEKAAVAHGAGKLRDDLHDGRSARAARFFLDNISVTRHSLENVLRN